ncbi:MAG: hypothetical protein OHK0046_52120 [Anaerolineae bacterium]
MANLIGLTALWMIREYKQPISPEEIAQLLAQPNDPFWQNRTVPRYVRRLLGDPNLSYGFVHDSVAMLSSLHMVGLIKRWEGSAASARYEWTPGLQVMQSVFEISLSRLLDSDSPRVDAFPLLGTPMRAGPQWARIFVAMPFRDDLTFLYADHILPVTQAMGISCKRGDDFYSARSIMGEVWSSIYHAELCIVDCTGRNPNVFYELGIAHTIGRPAVLLTQSMDDIPFDIRHLRILVYDPANMAGFDEALRRTIEHELA